MNCHFLPGSLVCEICGRRLRKLHPEPVYLPCDGPKCGHLGGPIERAGVPVLVKCSCGDRVQWHRSHVCDKLGRCLPTMRQEFDADHQAEASLYKLCYSCEFRSQLPTS